MNYSNSIHQTSFSTERKKKAIGFTKERLRDQCRKWEKNIAFTKKEASFFFWLLEKSTEVSTGEKKQKLIKLKIQIKAFRRQLLSSFLNQLIDLKQPSADSINFISSQLKYNALFKKHQSLSSEYENINTTFKELKSQAFILVDDFLRVRII